MKLHNLTDRAVDKMQQQALRGRRRLYRVAVERDCPEFPGSLALHPDGSLLWGVQGEALWTSRKLAEQAASMFSGAVVQDVTRKYTGICGLDD